ncbi:MAG: hypothetical protein Q2306_02355 [Phytoplasma sp.]|uniref:hypothetical protein n=1 Tax=Phytoplasma sp. TaxID=2155 RepID=UPI002B4113C8|nr:hypothetical protein [Phytoplasma sp.]WRH06711.1 MAG: hypothetical protein Q2306_02355 [Phytoplasma sp.]
MNTKIISCILFLFLSIFLVFWFRITLFPKYFKSEEKITPTIHNTIVTNVKDEPMHEALPLRER